MASANVGGEPTSAAPIPVEAARLVALNAQGLVERPPGPLAKADVLAVLERLGCVQLDTVNVVARSQYLAVFSRLGPYDPAWLDELLYPDRAIFEYWAHAASLVPMRDLPYYRQRMLDWTELGWYWNQEWAHRNGELLDRVLDEVRRRGPIPSSAFEHADDRRAGRWDWYGAKESRRALEVLWSQGRVMVHSRRNGQKVYDVTERVLDECPAELSMSLDRLDQDLPSAEERRRFFARRALRALGIARPSWLSDYFRTDWGLRELPKRHAATAALEELVALGEAQRVPVEGWREPAYVAAERTLDLGRALAGELRPSVTTLLSPFDNLIWDRARTRELFGFEYAIELYTPPEKRRYGYYVMPILHRGRLVGRLDPKLDRSANVLRVRALHLEPGVVLDDDLRASLLGALDELRVFLGAATLDCPDLAPSR